MNTKGHRHTDRLQTTHKSARYPIPNPPTRYQTQIGGLDLDCLDCPQCVSVPLIDTYVGT